MQAPILSQERVFGRRQQHIIEIRTFASKSLNIITSNEINFCLQSNEEADRTTATIAAQIKRARLEFSLALAVVAFKVWRAT